MAKPALKISAQEVLKDIRAGLEDGEFMLKYNLTYRQLQSLFRKLIKAGYVSPLELAQRLCVTQSQVTDVMGLVTKSILELDDGEDEL
jgi:DNA-binding MarR family transcriptional regulator